MKNNLKQVTLLILILFILPIMVQSKVKKDGKKVSLIDKLAIAEKNRDIKAIKTLYDANAILFLTDLPPIYGIDAIISLYKFSWKRPKRNPDKYINNSIKNMNNKIHEDGFYYFKHNNKDKKTAYRLISKKTNGLFKIIEFKFGKHIINSKTPKLIMPTGKHPISRSTFFYDKTSEKDRIVSFELWYPAQSEEHKKAPYHSKAVTKASAEFLGWPMFYNSYHSKIISNSYSNIKASAGKRFPIIIYHHGYSGFASVYQTIFEELASHGYIIVSIAHENESAILIKDEKTVIKTDKNNKFYKSHFTELNGTKINALQNVILNSDNLKKNTDAYKNLIKLSPLHNKSTRLWAMDTKLVIKKLREIDNKGCNLKEIFNFAKIGIMGHSVGGATAGQMAASSNLIKAGINLDGFQFGDLINKSIKIPFMFVSSNNRRNSFIRYSTFMHNSETICYQAIIRGFSHGTFTDLALFKPGGESDIKLQRELILTFFDIYLKNDKSKDLKELENKYNRIILRSNNKKLK